MTEKKRKRTRQPHWLTPEARRDLYKVLEKYHIRDRDAVCQKLVNRKYSTVHGWANQDGASIVYQPHLDPKNQERVQAYMLLLQQRKAFLRENDRQLRNIGPRSTIMTWMEKIQEEAKKGEKNV